MSWTDERVELLTRLWGDGLSASQIAGQLGGVSRNAVIGKVHRLKLGGRGAAADEEAGEPDAAVETVAEAQVIALPAAFWMGSAPPAAVADDAADASASVGEVAPFVATEAPLPRPSGEVVPMTRNLTLVQLTERTCKWPLGDPLAVDFRFCGNVSHEASPYCPYHARIAFQPVSERRRIR